MADNRLAEAVDMVAKWAIRAATDDHPAQAVAWENYPEIGERDWHRVVERIDELTTMLAPTPVEYEAAYEYLTERVDEDA